MLQFGVIKRLSHNLLDHDSRLIRNHFNLNHLTDFARGVLFDSNSDGILDSVASPLRIQASDLDAMISWQSISTDGAGRLAKRYLTDGGGDSAWSDADDVSGDIVLNQQEFTYDAAGNLILAVNRDRFHDNASATGARSESYAYDANGNRNATGYTVDTGGTLSASPNATL